MKKIAGVVIAAGAAMGLAFSLFRVDSPSAFTGPFGGPTGGQGLAAGPPLCFNASCSIYGSSDGSSAVFTGGPISSPSGFVEGVLAASTVDVPGQSFVASRASGTDYAFRSTNNARWDFGNGANDFVVSTGGAVSANSWSFADVTSDILDFTSDGLGMLNARIFPTGSLSTCASRAGTMNYLNTDDHFYGCNGTASQQLAYRAAWTGSLDFAVFAAIDCQDLTFTATGAVSDEPIAVGGCGAVHNGDPDLTCDVSISATNTARVRLCCVDAAGCADLASITFSAAAVR